MARKKQGVCPKSLLHKVSEVSGSSSLDSRFFPGITPPVIVVAILSFLAFGVVSLAAVVVAAIQTFFFFLLPLASAAGGAFLVAAPKNTPLGADPNVLIVVRLAGALAIAYAGTTILVGRCGCSKVRSASLALVAASLGAMSAAFVVDGSSAVAGEVGSRAALLLGRVAAAAAVGSLISAAGPAFNRKLQRGKPAGPAVLACSG